jgi:hypothetical protein
MADSAKLITTLEVRLDKFEKQLKEAGVIAEKGADEIEKKFSAINPSFAGGLLGGLFSGVFKEGARDLIKFLEAIPERFKEIKRTADLAAISMNDVFGFQSALGKSSFQEVDQAIQKLANLLDLAKRGQDNKLKEVFDIQVPPIAIASVKDAGDALLKLSGILSGLNSLHADQVLKALGLPESLLKDLQKGPEHLRELQEAAAKAAPDLQKLAEQAERFDKVWKESVEKFKGYIVAASDFAARKLAELIDILVSGLRSLDQIASPLGKQVFGPLADSLEKVSKALKDASPTRLTVNGKGETSTPLPPSGTGGGGRLDEFDRANNAVSKHIELLDAETKAVGLGTQAKEAARVEAQLLFAAEQAGLQKTDELIAGIKATANAAGDAALALEAAKNKLKEINDASREIGSALADAFKGATLEGKKLNEVMQQLLNRLASKSIDKVFDLFFSATTGNSTSLFAKLLTGGKAAGGPVSSGSPYLVGEKGPEIFVPKSNGMIVPNSVASTGGMGGSVVYAPNITISGASTVTQEQLALVLAAERAKVVPIVKDAVRRRAL